MKEITVKKYQTSDGKEFGVRDDAIAHQARLDVGASITKYVNATNKSRKEMGDDPLTERRVSHLVNVITEWEAWNAVVEASNKPVAVA